MLQGDPTYEVVGVVTMEDIIEVILQGGIEDEYDHNAGSDDSSDGGGEDAITRRTTFDYAHVRDSLCHERWWSQCSRCAAVQHFAAAAPARLLEGRQRLERHRGQRRVGAPAGQLPRVQDPQHGGARTDSGRSQDSGSPVPRDGVAKSEQGHEQAAQTNPNVRCGTPRLKLALALSCTPHTRTRAPPTCRMLGKLDVSSARRQVPAVVDGRLTAENKGDETKAEATQMAEDAALGMVYKRGRVDTFCTLVLSGTLEIHAGADGFRAEAHRFEIIAASALTLPAGDYVPDFSAYISSDVVRCLRIAHAQFQTALGHPPPVPLNRKRASSTQSGGHRLSITPGTGAGAGPDDVAVHIAPRAGDGKVDAKPVAPIGAGANARAPRARSGSTQVRRYAALIGASPDTPEHAGAEKPAAGVHVETEVLGSGAGPRDRAAAAQMSALISAAVDASVHAQNGAEAAAPTKASGTGVEPSEPSEPQSTLESGNGATVAPTNADGAGLAAGDASPDAANANGSS